MIPGQGNRLCMLHLRPCKKQNRNLLAPSSRGWKSKIKVSQCPTPSGGSRGRSSLPLPVSRGSSLPWLVTTTFKPLVLSSHGFLPISSICVCLGLAVCPAGPLSLGFLLFSWSHTTAPCFPWGSSLLTSADLHLSEGGIFMLITENSPGEIFLLPCVFSVYLTSSISTDAWAFTF